MRKIDTLSKAQKRAIIHQYEVRGDGARQVASWATKELQVQLYERDVYTLLKEADVPRRGPGGSEKLSGYGTARCTRCLNEDATGLTRGDATQLIRTAAAAFVLMTNHLAGKSGQQAPFKLPEGESYADVPRSTSYGDLIAAINTAGGPEALEQALRFVLDDKR
ncbi:hypothetical protein [Saccharothrix sp. ST-888]|uniref:hypothetical protein n=1 Tax=Saccharothrix sp. ST-888 TaxID=1427391 RepID=UPI0005EBF9AA|nr:hypothetical protein [Saccharothrix sp. ST-888]KJK56126.1 hypothetical protein UK12_24615 [Saccharothrix sp. ST-888]